LGQRREYYTKKRIKKERKKRLKGMQQNNKTTKKKNKKYKPKEYKQLGMTGKNVSRKDSEFFGDRMQNKPIETTRIALLNIQLLPENSKHYKSRQLIDHITQAQLDGIFLNEVGLNWKAIPPKDQWAECTFGKLMGSQATFANDMTELEHTEPIQYGGVGIVTNQDLSSRIIERGWDPKQLGQWVWIRIQGKEGHIARLATAYRPCESPGVSTVFHQQVRGLSKLGDHRSLRVAFMEDLAEEI
jgi:hypothetical protein